MIRHITRAGGGGDTSIVGRHDNNAAWEERSECAPLHEQGARVLFLHEKYRLMAAV